MKNKFCLSDIARITISAGELLLPLQTDVKRLKAARKDFLTTADLMSNSFITKQLGLLDPSIPIFSEEDEIPLSSKGKMWVVDPLDGTVNFFHQDQNWGVSVALVEDGRIKIGAICLPAQSKIFGCYDNGEVTSGEHDGVNAERDLSEAQIWTDWSKQAKDVPGILAKLQRVSLYPQIRLCATVSLMAVATGRISAYVHPHPAPEDFAAGALIVERAGGKVTDFSGQPWSIFSKSIVASNGILHDQILQAINEI